MLVKWEDNGRNLWFVNSASFLKPECSVVDGHW